MFSSFLQGLFIALIVLAVRALLKYLRLGKVRKEKAERRMSLDQVLKEHRQRCKMTQEFRWKDCSGRLSRSELPST